MPPTATLSLEPETLREYSHGDAGVIVYDCGTKETLLSTNRFILKKMDLQVTSDQYQIIPPVFVAKNCKVKGSTIGPYVMIENGVIVEDSVIKNSVILVALCDGLKKISKCYEASWLL